MNPRHTTSIVAFVALTIAVAVAALVIDKPARASGGAPAPLAVWLDALAAAPDLNQAETVTSTSRPITTAFPLEVKSQATWSTTIEPALDTDLSGTVALNLRTNRVTQNLFVDNFGGAGTVCFKGFAWTLLVPPSTTCAQLCTAQTANMTCRAGAATDGFPVPAGAAMSIPRWSGEYCVCAKADGAARTASVFRLARGGGP